MPSVTTLAFNYLTCWQLEVGKQEEKKKKGSEEQKAELDSDLMWTVSQEHHFLSTSLKNTHFVSTVRITYIFEKKFQLNCLMIFKKSPLGTYRGTIKELLK